MTELGLMENETLSLYCDNKPEINIAHNPVQHDRTKHVNMKFIKEKID